VLPQLATLFFAARKVGIRHGNTRNNVFQLAMQQCCDKSRSQKNVITGPSIQLFILSVLSVGNKEKAKNFFKCFFTALP